jgi:hypothetical protein
MSSKSSKPPKAISSDKVLLVEGSSPEHFFRALTRHLLIEDSIDIRNFGGNQDFSVYLRTLCSTTDFKDRVRSIGVIRDAETSASAARASIENAINIAKISPDVQKQLFILPDNKSPGNIETLCMRSVQDKPIISCVEQFLDCVTKSNGKVWPTDHKKDKALVQIYAATLDPPKPYAGLASYHHVWPWTSPVFAELVTFLQTL